MPSLMQQVIISSKSSGLGSETMPLPECECPSLLCITYFYICRIKLRILYNSDICNYKKMDCNAQKSKKYVK